MLSIVTHIHHLHISENNLWKWRMAITSRRDLQVWTVIISMWKYKYVHKNLQLHQLFTNIRKCWQLRSTIRMVGCGRVPGWWWRSSLGKGRDGWAPTQPPEEIWSRPRFASLADEIIPNNACVAFTTLSPIYSDSLRLAQTRSDFLRHT